jgi:NAD(P)-dependent dehydrogenase (short-subunit alcohol dehydrogenase family)
MQDSRFTLAGKVALVTGASRGIGRAIAGAYAAAGAQVVLSSRKQAGLDAAAAEIQAQGGQALAVAAHTGSLEAVENLLAQVTQVYGGVDILLNNAATNPHFGPILEAEESMWQKTLDVNVVGYWRLAKLCAESMKIRGGGSIINVASVAGRRPQPGMGIYCASKAAVLMLTEVLAVELAADRIRVNAIAPGFVKTRFSQVLWQDESLYDRITASIPQKRMAESHELEGLALYLASAASSFMTGETLVIDGGQLVASGLNT